LCFVSLSIEIGEKQKMSLMSLASKTRIKDFIQQQQEPLTQQEKQQQRHEEAKKRYQLSKERRKNKRNKKCKLMFIAFLFVRTEEGNEKLNLHFIS